MILNGKEIAHHILQELKENICSLAGKKPGLAFILVGHHPASHAYVTMKKKRCSEIGIHSEIHFLPETIEEKELVRLIHTYNKNPEIHGILVQQPLPSHLQSKVIVKAIDPSKDVDGFHPLNIGKALLGYTDGFLPCTPLGIVTLLKKAKIPTAGKHAVIMGRSNIVGKPLAALLMQKECNATVTVVHSQTPNLQKLSKQADILIAAIGKPHFVTEEFVKEGAVVVDVGINALQDRAGRRIVGDVDFAKVSPKCSSITPVPGGIGPMTIAMLLHNTYLSCLKSL